jgi:hypothetical protein
MTQTLYAHINVRKKFFKKRQTAQESSAWLRRTSPLPFEGLIIESDEIN